MYRVIKADYDPKLVDKLIEYYFYRDNTTLATAWDEVANQYTDEIADEVVEGLKHCDRFIPEN